MTFFDLKMMVKSGLHFFFQILRAPLELLLHSAKKSAQNDWIGQLAGISEGAPRISKWIILDREY